MGQDISGTALATTTVAASQTPTMQFKIDWADAGFGAEGSWTDESAYVKSIRGSAQAVDPQQGAGAVGYGVAAVATVTLDNPLATTPYSGRRFSPSNAGGPLYGYIGGGAVRMKRAVVSIGYYSGATPERLRQITGYIVDLTEDYAANTVTLEIRDRAADCVRTRQSTTLYASTTAKVYLQVLCSLLGKDPVTAGDQVFDEGLIPIDFAWLDEETAWDEMAVVAQSQAGRVWFDKDGDLHFADGAGMVKPRVNAWDDQTVSQFTFTTGRFQASSPRYDPRAVKNHVVVRYRPRYVAVEQVIYTSAETLVVAPGETKTLTADFRYPASSIVTPAADTDYVAVTGGGTDITADLSIVLTGYAQRAELAISNNNPDYQSYVVLLQLRGQPVLSDAALTYECEGPASIEAYGRQTLPIRDNPFVQSFRQAQMLAELLLARLKSGIQTVSISGAPAVPYLEVGDRVTVQETPNLAINEDFFIEQIDWSYQPSGMGIYTANYEVMRAADVFPVTDYFVIGTSKYGSGAGHGHLFW